MGNPVELNLRAKKGKEQSGKAVYKYEEENDRQIIREL